MEAITRPSVTINLANRNIGRMGALANRLLHPLAASSFGRVVGPIVQTSDVKVSTSQHGLTVNTEYGETLMQVPLYSNLLRRAGVENIKIPKGTEQQRIMDIFHAVTMRTTKKAQLLLANLGVISGTELGILNIIISDPLSSAEDIAHAISSTVKKDHKVIDQAEKNRYVMDQPAIKSGIRMVDGGWGFNESTGDRWEHKPDYPVETGGTPEKGHYEIIVPELSHFRFSQASIDRARALIEKHEAEKQKEIMEALSRINPELFTALRQ